jgi:hypothetical protein
VEGVDGGVEAWAAKTLESKLTTTMAATTFATATRTELRDFIGFSIKSAAIGHLSV